MDALQAKKTVIYPHLFDTLIEEHTVSASTLSLGKHLFSSKKGTEDVLISSLRTFSSVQRLKLFVNEKVALVLAGVMQALVDGAQ